MPAAIETRPHNAGRRRIRFAREYKAVDMKSSAQGSNPAGAERGGFCSDDHFIASSYAL